VQYATIRSVAGFALVYDVQQHLNQFKWFLYCSRTLFDAADEYIIIVIILLLDLA